jgi:hypothetical protein
LLFCDRQQADSSPLNLASESQGVGSFLRKR